MILILGVGLVVGRSITRLELFRLYGVGDIRQKLIRLGDMRLWGHRNICLDQWRPCNTRQEL